MFLVDFGLLFLIAELTSEDPKAGPVADNSTVSPSVMCAIFGYELKATGMS